jgi:hypothetical protein
VNDLNIHKRLRVYEFNDKYIKFLHSFDSKVHFPTGISYTTSVKYIGIIASNSMVIYFAPMSSDKNQFYKHKIQANTFEKLMTPGTIAYPSIYVGVLLLNNQIPVNITKREKILLSVDPYSQKNKQYGNLLALELQ